MKRLFALMLAATMTLSLVACGDSAKTGGDTATGSSEPAETTVDANVLNVSIASEPASLDPALNSAVDGATMLVHLFSGLAKFEQKADGSLELVPDAATELRKVL